MASPPPAATAPRLDRRHARRAETIEQLLGVAVDVMADYGVAGLSLGEVARRMGIRPPSLYVYFASKNAVYDAVFARGWTEVLRATTDRVPDPTPSTELAAYLRGFADVFVRWNVEHPVQSQLMGWRPVPGYVPSAEAYRPAVAALARCRETFARLQRLGLLRTDADVDEMVRVWTVLTSGVVSQQLANAPDEPFETGSFTSLLTPLVAMYLALYKTPTASPAPHLSDTRAEALLEETDHADPC